MSTVCDQLSMLTANWRINRLYFRDEYRGISEMRNSCLKISRNHSTGRLKKKVLMQLKRVEKMKDIIWSFCEFGGSFTIYKKSSDQLIISRPTELLFKGFETSNIFGDPSKFILSGKTCSKKTNDLSSTWNTHRINCWLFSLCFHHLIEAFIGSLHRRKSILCLAILKSSELILRNGLAVKLNGHFGLPC